MHTFVKKKFTFIASVFSKKTNVYHIWHTMHMRRHSWYVALNQSSLCCVKRHETVISIIQTQVNLALGTTHGDFFLTQHMLQSLTFIVKLWPVGHFIGSVTFTRCTFRWSTSILRLGLCLRVVVGWPYRSLVGYRLVLTGQAFGNFCFEFCKCKDLLILKLGLCPSVKKPPGYN